MILFHLSRTYFKLNFFSILRMKRMARDHQNIEPHLMLDGDGPCNQIDEEGST